eukprot:Sspe_Gene.15154::Locus_5261_Transcript_1_1_Confidence_1.000_Length_5134::g.15154::m.15154
MKDQQPPPPLPPQQQQQQNAERPRRTQLRVDVTERTTNERSRNPLLPPQSRSPSFTESEDTWPKSTDVLMSSITEEQTRTLSPVGSYSKKIRRDVGRLSRASDNSKDYGNYICQWLYTYLASTKASDSIDHMCQEVQGAVIFIDIVGFTQLTEALAGQAGGSVESVSVVLNSLFGKILGLVKAFGGDVIQFSGDAVMVIFAEDMFDDGDYAEQCLLCAVTIQNTMASTTVPISGKGTVDVMLRMGMATGLVVRMVVGGFRGKWTAVAGGEACTAACLACAKAVPGHLLVHPSAAFLLHTAGIEGNEVSLPDSPSGSPKCMLVSPNADSHLSVPLAKVRSPRRSVQVNESKLRSFLPGGVTKQHRSEIRNLVTVFIKFCGIPMVTKAQAAQINTVAHTLERLSMKYCGVCNKIVYDDKGLVALVCFGLPLFVNIDGSERACCFAVEVVKSLEDKVGQLGIGIAKDRVYCGELGNSYRAEYAVLGDGVNLSSRLVGAGLDEFGATGKSTVAVDDVVRLEVNATVFEGSSRITLKGKSDEVAVSLVDVNRTYDRILEGLQYDISSRSSIHSISSRSSGSMSFEGSRSGSASSMRSERTPRARVSTRVLPINEGEGSTVGYGQVRHTVGRTQQKRALQEFLQSLVTSSQIQSSSITNLSNSVGSIGNLRHSSSIVSSMEDPPSSARVVVIEGACGLGRTTLLRHFVTQCAGNVPVITLNAAPMTQHLPGAAVGHILRKIVEQYEKQFVESTLSECTDAEEHHRLLSLLAPNLFPPVQGNEAESIDSSDRLRSLLTPLFDAIAAKSQKKVLVLAIDDFQWVDPVSMSAVLKAVESTEQKCGLVCTVLSSTEAPVAATAETTSRGSQCTVSDASDAYAALEHVSHLLITLPPMTPSECHTHCKLYLQATGLDTSISKLVYDYCDGTPLLTEKILEALLEKDVITFTSDGEVALVHPDVDMHEVLASAEDVENIILRTLDKLTLRLSPPAAELVRIACAIGRSFTVELLAEVLSIHPDAPSISSDESVTLPHRRTTIIALTEEDAMQGQIKHVEALCRDLVKRKLLIASPGGTYSFVSATQPVIQYKMMLPSEKETTHLKIACGMAKLLASGRAYSKGEIARHFYRSGNTTSAVKWFAAAAQEEFTRENYADARTYLLKIFHIIGDNVSSSESDAMSQLSGGCTFNGRVSDAQIATWRCKLIKINMESGKYSSALSLFQKHYNFYDQAIAENIQTRVTSTRGTSCWGCCVAAPGPEPTETFCVSQDDFMVFQSIAENAVLYNNLPLFYAAANVYLRSLVREKRLSGPAKLNPRARYLQCLIDLHRGGCRTSIQAAYNSLPSTSMETNCSIPQMMCLFAFDLDAVNTLQVSVNNGISSAWSTTSSPQSLTGASRLIPLLIATALLLQGDGAKVMRHLTSSISNMKRWGNKVTYLTALSLRFFTDAVFLVNRVRSHTLLSSATPTSQSAVGQSPGVFPHMPRESSLISGSENTEIDMGDNEYLPMELVGGALLRESKACLSSTDPIVATISTITFVTEAVAEGRYSGGVVDALLSLPKKVDSALPIVPFIIPAAGQAVLLISFLCLQKRVTREASQAFLEWLLPHLAHLAHVFRVAAQGCHMTASAALQYHRAGSVPKVDFSTWLPLDRVRVMYLLGMWRDDDLLLQRSLEEAKDINVFLPQNFAGAKESSDL